MVAGIAVLVLVKVFSQAPWLVESAYYRGLYPLIRYLNDYTLGFLPFPIVYLAFPLMVVFIVRCLRRGIKATGTLWLGIPLGIGNVLGWLVAFFYIIWGFNYQRPPIVKTLDISTSTTADSIALVTEFLKVTDLYSTTRQAIDTSSAALDHESLPDTLEHHIRHMICKVLDAHAYAVPGRPRIRVLRPQGALLRIGTAGVYMPFAIEGQIDAGLHPIQYPYVMAHEFGHSYGFTDEGVCNFLALLACMQSDLPMVRYSALRSYWIYLARDVRKLDEDIYREAYSRLSKSVKVDYAAVREQMDRFPDILPDLRDLMYDTYLKTNGVKAGLSSYGQVVGLALAYQEKYGSIL